MIEDPEVNGNEYTHDGALVEQPPEKKGLTKAQRLIGIASLALVLMLAVILLTPSLRKDFLPKRARAAKARAASAVAAPESLPAVPVVWAKVDLAAMPADAVPYVRLGKYFYDRRLPGNFGLALDYWKRSLARLSGPDRDAVWDLIQSANKELAAQFSADSGDAFVLLKQGKREEAVSLLERMRADFFDITARQYIWASIMLARGRR